jgi:hypothetical protein
MDGLHIVFRHSVALAVHLSEIFLCVGYSCFSSLTEPMGSLSMVSVHTYAIPVHQTEQVLG